MDGYKVRYGNKGWLIEETSDILFPQTAMDSIPTKKKAVKKARRLTKELAEDRGSATLVVNKKSGGVSERTTYTGDGFK